MLVNYTITHRLVRVIGRVGCDPCTRLFGASPLGSCLQVRDCNVLLVNTVDTAKLLCSTLKALPPRSVVAWNIEAADVDSRRFHMAGTGGRVLSASCVVDSVESKKSPICAFVDPVATSASEDSDSDSDQSIEFSAILSELKSYFEDPTLLKCSHSAADDYHLLQQQGIELRGMESDTRYLSRLANTALASWEGTAGSDADSDIVPKGYDLRASVASFGLNVDVEYSDKKLERFLKRLNGPKIAHFSSTMRPYWIGRCVEGAFLTNDLRHHLKQKLEESEWKSEIFPTHMHKDKSMWDLYSLVMRPLVTVLATVEHTGMRIDSEFLNLIREKTVSLVEFHSNEFRKICMQMRDPSDTSSFLNPDADMLNPHSVQHVRQLLFGFPSNRESEWFSYGKKSDKLKIPKSQNFTVPTENDGDRTITVSGIGLRPIKSRMGKKRLADYSAKGLPSVNQKLLLEYAGKDPVNGVYGRAADMDQLGKFGPEYVKEACLMLHHLSSVSRYQYVLGSFVDPLIEKVVQYRIHPSLSLDTSTGRLACKKPNLHNPPNASDTFGLRAAFVASPGCSMVVADYSQVELRILAHVTQCESMIRSLNAGGDYHSRTAMDMFPHVREAVESGAIPIGQVKHDFAAERSKAKAVNFSIAYGKCARSIAEDMDCQLAEAEALLAAWYASKPEVAAWKADAVFQARVTKKATSILGRTRDIPHIDNKLWKGRSERAAVNHCIQGSAADIAICAMIQIGQSERLQTLGFKLLMQIHDEFIIEGPSEHAEEAKGILVHLMQNPFQTLNPEYKFRVPLEVDAGIGPNWLEAKP